MCTIQTEVIIKIYSHFLFSVSSIKDSILLYSVVLDLSLHMCRVWCLYLQHSPTIFTHTGVLNTDQYIAKVLSPQIFKTLADVNVTLQELFLYSSKIIPHSYGTWYLPIYVGQPLPAILNAMCTVCTNITR